MVGKKACSSISPVNAMWRQREESCILVFCSAALVLCGPWPFVGLSSTTIGRSWAYLKGPKSTADGGNYVHLGEYGPDAHPRAQSYSGLATDSAGVLWLFEGSSTPINVFSWNGTEWRWAYRSPVTSASGTYVGPDIQPGYRDRALLWRRKTCPGFVLFGGYGRGNSLSSYGYLR